MVDAGLFRWNAGAVGHNAAIMPLPDWARSTYRIWANAQAITLLIVTVTAVLKDIDVRPGRTATVPALCPTG